MANVVRIERSVWHKLRRLQDRFPRKKQQKNMMYHMAPIVMLAGVIGEGKSVNVLSEPINTADAEKNGCWEMINLDKSKLHEAISDMTQKGVVIKGLVRVGNFDVDNHAVLGNSLKKLADTKDELWMLSMEIPDEDYGLPGSYVCDRYKKTTIMKEVYGKVVPWHRYRKIRYEVIAE